MRKIMFAVAAGLLCFSMAISAQNRFSGAIEPGAKVFFGDKTGGSFGADAVLGVLHDGKLFFGLGIGCDLQYLENEQYNPNIPADRPRIEPDFTQPKTLKTKEVPLFLSVKYYWDSGRFRPTVDCRAGMSFSMYGVGGKFLSVGAGCRYDLTANTGLAFRAYYEIMRSWYADDVYDSYLGWFNSIGLRVAYEF